MMNAAVLGFGYWGPNLARNIHKHPHLNLTAISDRQAEKRLAAQNQYPNIQVYEDARGIMQDEAIQIVVIATSVDQHYALAKEALENGKHVLVEKPAGASYAKLLELHELAKQKGLVLMVDYTFLYNGAIGKLLEITGKETFGKINYIDSTRINLGIFQTDINVIWDLASHDVAIVNHLTGKLPKSVKANGICHTNNGIENIAYLTLIYEDTNLIVHFNCSWTSPVKIRQMLIGGEKKMVIYNDIEPTDKIKVYDCNFNFAQDNREKLLIDYRLGDITIPLFDSTEPLYAMIDDFHQSISQRKKPVASSEVALRVSKVLEAAQHSIKNNGKEVFIE